MTAPLVSILIPCYNAAPWLAQTLESALAQTYPYTEIIVVDDGSTDSSPAIARSFAPRGVRLIEQRNSGASSARNHALRESRGEWIQFLDADDLLSPDKIAAQVTLLETRPPGTVASCAWARFTSHPDTASFSTEPNWRDLSGIDFMRLHYAAGWMMPPIAWLSPRPLLEVVGPWREDISLNDDGEYFCRVLTRSAGIAFCPGGRVYYRSGLPGSLSRRSDMPALRSLVRSIEANIATLLESENSPRVRSIAANAWLRLAHDIYPQLPREAQHAEQQSRVLGGSSLRVSGGRLIRYTESLLGWRAAARLKSRIQVQ